MVTFILAILERNWETDSAIHRYDAKTRPDSNEVAAHIHKHQHEFDKDTEVLILKGNLHQKHERELWKDKFICLLGTKFPHGTWTETLWVLIIANDCLRKDFRILIFANLDFFVVDGLQPVVLGGLGSRWAWSSM